MIRPLPELPMACVLLQRVEPLAEWVAHNAAPARRTNYGLHANVLRANLDWYLRPHLGLGAGLCHRQLRFGCILR